MKDTLYITTAIPYVNADPHVGNVLDYLYADIWARYHRQHGKNVRLQAGTDEHGNKIAAKAQEANKPVQDYVDEMHLRFKNLIEKLGVEYTDFVRTSDMRHMAAVQYIWQQITPYIYKQNYQGWYCQGCEAFVSDNEATANNGICPDHKQSYQRVEEENYYFKTSAFADQIRQAITTGQMQILPQSRQNEFLKLIESGLEDVSVSRPKKSLSWGIPVPDDPDQVMYVWFDALSNYLTVVGYPDQSEWQQIWPADVQVIGKDILRFHAGIWPAMLLALNLPLPKRLLVHGHIQVDGVKMSKTIGNVVDPIELIDNYGADAVRYFFSRHIPTQDDGDFTWERFETAYNSELGNDFGNLIQRVASMVERYQAGVVSNVEVANHDENAYATAMQELRFNDAIDEAWCLIHNLNRYVDSVKPWEIAKKAESDPDSKQHLSEVLDYATSGILQVARLLEPFLPSACARITKIFGTGVVDTSELPLFPKIYIHTPDPRAKHAG